MDRLFRAAPILLLCAVVGYLTYSHFTPTIAPPSDGGNTLEWSEAVSERINKLDKSHALLVKRLFEQDSFAPIEERVIELPEDGSLWQTVIVAPQDDASGAHLRQQLRSDPRLVSLQAQTKVYDLSPNHWWVKQRLPGARLPAIVIQRPISATEAKVIYKASGANLPSDSTTLANEIEAAIADCTDCRPRPTPTPQPEPETTPDPIPDLRPPGTPEVQPADDNLGILAYAMIAAAGLGGAYLGVKRDGGL